MTSSQSRCGCFTSRQQSSGLGLKVLPVLKRVLERFSSSLTQFRNIEKRHIMNSKSAVDVNTAGFDSSNPRDYECRKSSNRLWMNGWMDGGMTNIAVLLGQRCKNPWNSKDDHHHHHFIIVLSVSPLWTTCCDCFAWMSHRSGGTDTEWDVLDTGPQTPLSSLSLEWWVVGGNIMHWLLGKT